MQKVNNDKLVDGKITSRYTIVLAVAKRARQIIDGDDPLTYAPTDRAVSIAVKEMDEGKIRINVEEDLLDGTYERMLASQSKFQPIVAATSDDLREDLKDNYAPVTYVKDTDDDLDDDYKEDLEVPEDVYLYDEDEEPPEDEAFDSFDDEDEM